MTGQPRLEEAARLKSIHQAISLNVGRAVCEDNDRTLSVPFASEELEPIPNDCIALGMAEDGLPILLNTKDPVCGAILLIADERSGKTSFLRSVAAQVNKADETMEFSVITPSLWEWEDFTTSRRCTGIFHSSTKTSQNLIEALRSWMEQNIARHPIFLLIDNLDALQDLNAASQDALQTIIQFGAQRNVWPIATLDPARAGRLRTWTSHFRTHFLGYSTHIRYAHTLARGWQFAMTADSGWIKFQLME